MSKFKIGQLYSRKEIGSKLGGSQQAYLPFKDGVVLCGCFRRNPENPSAPNEVLVGSSPVVKASAELVSRQKEPIPVFIFRDYRKWEFMGEYVCKEFSRNPTLIRQKERENPRRGSICGVLHFERSS